MCRCRTVLFGCFAALAVALLTGCGTSTGPQEAGQTTEMTFTASVRQLDTMTVASIGHTGPLADLPAVMGRLVAWAGTAGVTPAGAPFGVFYDSPDAAPESMVYELCLPVKAGTAGDSTAGVSVKPFGGIKVATTTCTGPFDRLTVAYDSLEMWVDANGYAVSGPAIEFYLSDPQATPAESLRTEIALAVQDVTK